MEKYLDIGRGESRMHERIRKDAFGGNARRVYTQQSSTQIDEKFHASARLADKKEDDRAEVGEVEGEEDSCKTPQKYRASFESLSGLRIYLLSSPDLLLRHRC